MNRQYKGRDTADPSDYQIVPIPKRPQLTHDNIVALTELGEILRSIHNRLISEGYIIVEGKITKPEIIKF